MGHNIVFIPTGAGQLPHAVLAPPCYSLGQAREVVEEVIKALPVNHDADSLAIALGRRGFVWPNTTQAQVPA